MPTQTSARRRATRASAARRKASAPARANLGPRPTLQVDAIYSEPEAAALLGALSPRTLERWRSEGRGPKHLRFGRRVRYHGADLKAFIDRAKHRESPGSDREHAAASSTA